METLFKNKTKTTMKTEKLTVKDAMLYPNATIDYDGEKLNIFGYLQKFSIVIESGKIPMNCKLILRPIESLTEEEKSILREDYGINFSLGGINSIEKLIEYSPKWDLKEAFDKLREWNIDIDGFIASGKAVAE